MLVVSLDIFRFVAASWHCILTGVDPFRAQNTVLLGGAAFTPGPSPSKMRRLVSSNIRCMACNQAVIRLPGKKWAGDVHYMTFRNNYPSVEKLERDGAFVRAESFAAYCCMCNWVSVGEEIVTITRSSQQSQWR